MQQNELLNRKVYLRKKLVVVVYIVVYIVVYNG